MLQMITLEDGQPVFQGSRLLCVQPGGGKVALAESPLAKRSGRTLVFRNFAGKLFDYPDLPPR